MVYQCRSCKKIYKTLGWFKRHCRLQQHNPVWEELLPVSQIRKIIQEELSKLKFARAEPIVRITTTTTTEIPLDKVEEWRNAKAGAYRECMNELKSKFIIDLEKAEVC